MTEQEIRTQYGQACAEAGELQYKIKQLSKSLEDINGKIELLNQQYVDLLNKKKAEETKDVPAQS